MKTTTQTEEQFDAVQTMRRIRAQLNEELEGKSFREVRERLDALPSDAPRRERPSRIPSAKDAKVARNP